MRVSSILKIQSFDEINSIILAFKVYSNLE